MEATLVSRLTTVRSGLVRIDQQREYEEQQILRLTAKIKQIEEEKAELLKAVGVIDRCIQLISAQGIGKIESIVTGGLQLVFDDPTAGLIVEKKEGARGNSYRLLVRQGDTTGDPMQSFGGGMVNVVAFLLRVIMIKRFKLKKFLVLDETFANLNDFGGTTYARRVSQLLHDLCKNHGYTILVVTLNGELASEADAVYQVLPQQGRPPILRKLEAQEVEELRGSVTLKEAQAEATQRDPAAA